MSQHHLMPLIPEDSIHIFFCILISHMLMNLFLDFSLCLLDLFALLSQLHHSFLCTFVTCPTWRENHHFPPLPLHPPPFPSPPPSSFFSSFLTFGGFRLVAQMVKNPPAMQECCAVLSHSVVSDSLRPYGLYSARLLCP